MRAARLRFVSRRVCSVASRVTLLDASEAKTLATGTARQLTVRVAKDDTQVRLLDIFVCRDLEGRLRAFENYCPHAGGPLNMLPDRFFTRDGTALLCTSHGAKFSPTDGECFHGPCAGKALHMLELEEDESGAIATCNRALESLCESGGGAFILRERHVADAQGPQVQRPISPPPRPARSRRRASIPRTEGTPEPTK